MIRDETSKRKKKLYSSGLIFAAWTGMRDIKGGNSFVKQNKTEQKKQHTAISDCEESKHFSTPEYRLRRHGVTTMW